MAVNIPTTNELYTSILADLESNLGVTIPLFGRLYLRATAAVQAAKIRLIYLAIADVQKNIFVDTADPEAIGGTLERFGRVKLRRSPFSAVAGSYGVLVTGTAGAVITATTTFKSNDSSLNPGKLYVLDNDYTLVAGTNVITLRALEAGIDSRLNVGDELTATSPIANVDSIGIVDSEIVTPLAPESTEDYRHESIIAYQLEPQGGAGSDYRIWAGDAQGVKQVYPYVKQGYPNEIEIFVEATVTDSTDGKGTPPPSMISEVESVIEFDPDVSKPLNERGRRPLGLFDTNVQAISVREVDIVIVGFNDVTPNDQTLISNALTNFINEIRPFVASANVLSNKNDILNTFNVSAVILEAVPSAVFDSIQLFIDSEELLSFRFLGGDIPNLQSISYV